MKYFKIIFLIFAFPAISFTQWDNLGWKSYPSINDFHYSLKNNIYLATEEGIQLIDTNGKILNNFSSFVFQKFKSFDNKVIANSFNNFYITTEEENIWKPFDDFEIPENGDLNLLIVKDNLYIMPAKGNNTSIFISRDKGESWKFKPTKLPNYKYTHTSDIKLDSDNNIYIAISVVNEQKRSEEQFGGLFVSKDFGESWQKTGAQKIAIKKIYLLYNKIILDIKSGINNTEKSFLISENKGLDFNEIDFGFVPMDFYAKGNIVYSASTNGVYKSTDSITNWHKIGENLVLIKKLSFINNSIYGLGNDTIYKFNEETNKWRSIYKVENFGKVSSLFNYQNNIYAVGNNLMLSKDNGSNWEILNINDKNLFSIFISDDKIFLGTIENGLFISKSIENIELVQQTNNTQENPLIDFTKTTVFSIEKHKNFMYVGTNRGLFKSTASLPYNWKVDSVNFYNKNVLSIKNFNNTLYCQCYGLYKSENNGKTWEKIFFDTELENRVSCYQITSNGDILLGYAKSGEKSGVYFSNDNGITFSNITGQGFKHNKVIEYDVYKLFSLDDFIFAMPDKGIFYKKNDDTNWKSLINGIDYSRILCIDTTNKYIICGTEKGFYRLNREYLMTSATQEPSFESILIFPNPSSDFINFTLNDCDKYQYIIVDNTGKLIANGAVVDSKINIASLPKGSYFIKLFSSIESYTTKFIKQ